MKIAYLSTFYPFRGGIAQFNAALYRELEKEHDIKAFTFTTQYPNILFPGETQFVTENDIADPIPSERILNTVNPFSYFTAARKVKAFDPDLIITKFWMPFFAPSLGWVLKSNKKKSTNICILDNVIPHEKRPGDISLTKFFLNQNHKFIAMSDTVEKDLLSLKKNAVFERYPHPLYDHFPESLDRKEACDKLGLPKNKKLLLFFGFIRDYKGLDILIETLSHLDDEYHLVIAGEIYGDFTKYDEMIKLHKVEDRVSKFVRYIGDDEVPAFFSAADVCVLPYKSATQSGIVGISYNFNLPVIATDVGSLKEMIEPYQTGLMVNKAEVGLLKNAIEDYFKKEKREEYSKNISRYREIASWKSLAKKLTQMV